VLVFVLHALVIFPAVRNRLRLRSVCLRFQLQSHFCVIVSVLLAYVLLALVLRAFAVASDRQFTCVRMARFL